MAAVITYGLMVELAYTADLKSADHLGFAGSSPAGATTGALCPHTRPRGGMADALSSDLSAHEKWVCGFETRRGHYAPSGRRCFLLFANKSSCSVLPGGELSKRQLAQSVRACYGSRGVSDNNPVRGDVI